MAVIRRALAGLEGPALLIDVGCGSGRILARAARPGDLPVAADKDPRLLRVAAARGLRPVQVDFDLPLPFADESFDAALMIDTIEHVAEPRRALRELQRLLRPGGIAIVFTPPYDSVRWNLAERLHHLITGRPADHISPFTRESLAWAMASCFGHHRLGRVNWSLSMYAIARKPAGEGAGPTG